MGDLADPLLDDDELQPESFGLTVQRVDRHGNPSPRAAQLSLRMMHGSNMHDLRAVVRKCLKLHPRRLLFRDMATRDTLEDGDLVHPVRHNIAVAVVPRALHEDSESCEE
eukprot:6457666-Amphidinium_carterae.1